MQGDILGVLSSWGGRGPLVGDLGAAIFCFEGIVFVDEGIKEA